MLSRARYAVLSVSRPYMRMKKPALIASILFLFLIYFSILTTLPDGELSDDGMKVENSPAPRLRQEPIISEAHRQAPTIATNELEELEHGSVESTAFGLRSILPLFAGYIFGFLGSVPVTGPTSAMVLKLGIQGNYEAGFTVAVGGALSEATYAGIAFWGFGSFLAGAKFLLPVSKVLGAVMLTIVGLVFLRSDVTQPSSSKVHSSSHLHSKVREREVIIKDILLGVTLSGVNPALLATYTGAIASVYGTGLLEFTVTLAFVFGLGVACGISTWFYVLLSLLRKYKSKLKNETMQLIMRCMGCFLLTLGLFFAKSSVDYFFFQSTNES